MTTTSPTSERRARLIREMAQDLNRTRQSLHSNPDFADLTGSNLSVEEESSQAYRDHSHNLPSIRNESRTNTRVTGRPSLDFVIDTSAIGRAFPDMTGSGSSVDDDESSISIELGRGLRRDGQRDLSQDGSSDIVISTDRYKVDLGRLPQRSHSNVGRSSLRQVENADDDQVLRSSPPPLKATAYGTSGSSSRRSSAEQQPQQQQQQQQRQHHHHHHRQPSFKATVEEASDHTGSSSSRPSTQNLTVRSSRFSRGNGKPDAAAATSAAITPKRFTSAKDLLQNVEGAAASPARARNSLKPAQTVDNPTITTTNGGTAQSFMLPNMPNLSELVSGVYDDGTPVFSRTTAGRFKQGPRSSVPKHPALQSLPVPQDEEAIMMSLRLLQEKVQQLERSKAEAEVVVKELRAKNQSLEDERRAFKRSSRYDSGVGSSGGSDAGDESMMDSRKGTMERNRLQSNVRNLQHELDGANRRAAVAEANSVNIASERDSVISQLGVAFVTQEELKVDNNNLRAENKRLKLEIKKYRAAIESYIQRAESEKMETKSKMTEEEESAAAPQETRSVDCQVLDVDTPKRPTTRRQASRNEAVSQEPTRQETQTQEHGQEQGHEQEIQVPKRRRRRVIVEDYTVTSDFTGFNDESVQRIREASMDLSRAMSRNTTQTRPMSRAASTKSIVHKAESVREPTQREATRDITRASAVSFLIEDDVTILRRMLEKEHLQKKGRIASAASNARPVVDGEEDHFDVTKLTNPTAQSQARPRKSSMKEVSGRINVRPETTAHTDIDDEEQTSLSAVGRKAHRRRHSEESLVSKAAGKLRSQLKEDLTSAFILPDITMNVRQRRQSQGAADTTAPLSFGPGHFGAGGRGEGEEEEEEEEVIHEAQNCTICTRLLGTCAHTKGNDDVDDPTNQVNIPKPILASERIKDLALEGEDHTERPSEPPSQALAKTIKALEDEFAHLGLQLSSLQKQYNELDPSLQKRKRKAMGVSIDSLRAAMDAKGDQIYALYDVLEGHHGQPGGGGRHHLDDMTEQELNDTLTSILGGGEDDVDQHARTPTAPANMATLGMPTGIMFKRGQKTSSADVTPAKERPQPRMMSLGGSDLSAITEKTEKSRPGTSSGEGAATVAATAAATPTAAASNGRGKTVRKFPWDESYDDHDEDAVSLSWAGFDDTMDLTRGSQKSNTSSKRRNNATETL